MYPLVVTPHFPLLLESGNCFIFFFLMAEHNSIVWKLHVLFIYSPVVSTFLNYAAVKMYKFLHGHIVISLGYICRSGITRPYGICLVFWGTAKLFFKVAESFYNATSHEWKLQFLHILISTCYSLFHCSYPSRCDMMCYYGQSYLTDLLLSQGSRKFYQGFL